MKVRKISMALTPSGDSPVTLTVMGNILEVRYLTKKVEPKIKKQDKDHYIDLRTGEVCEFNHNTTRAEDMGSVAQSLRRLRAIINTNVTDPRKTLWCTLTYRKNMTDHHCLYQDFRRFSQRLKTYHQKRDLPHYEYIVAAEPQSRGAWHMQLLLIYQVKSPFIPNSDMEAVWRHGFSKTKALKNVDNVGAYLSAYLGDMELNECLHGSKLYANANVKALSETNEQGVKGSKYYVKGARLRLYPKGFRLYRRSKGIKLPEIIKMSYSEAMEIIGGAPLIYEKEIELLDDYSGTVYNQISYKQYNQKAKSNY